MQQFDFHNNKSKHLIYTMLRLCFPAWIDQELSRLFKMGWISGYKTTVPEVRCQDSASVVKLKLCVLQDVMLLWGKIPQIHLCTVNLYKCIIYTRSWFIILGQYGFQMSTWHLTGTWPMFIRLLFRILFLSPWHWYLCNLHFHLHTAVIWYCTSLLLFL